MKLNSNKLRVLAFAILYPLSSILTVFGQGTPIATTGFTRTMLRGADSAAVRDTLGFLTTNNTVITNYTGNGASITNLNADELRSGTVPLARLSGITATQVADASLTTNKVDATFHALLGGGGSGDVTEAGLAAGSYDLGTNVLTRSITNQWSRGTGRYYGAVITDGGLPLTQNNGWGSVDLQVATFPEVAGAYSGTANTNSAGGLANFIGGGWGNLIYQNQEGYDAGGFHAVGSSIGGGTFNTMINADTCAIGWGDNNYIGHSAGNPQNYVDDSFIPFGITCAILDSIDAMAMGWASTNSGSGGSMAMGWHCWLDGGGKLALGDYVWIRGSSHATVGIGKSVLLTNALQAIVVGEDIKIADAASAGAFGIGLTNSTHGDYQFGVGTNCLTVSSNGNVRVSGSGRYTGSAAGLTNFSTLVSSSASQTFDTSTIYTNTTTKTLFVQSSWQMSGSVGVGDDASVSIQIDQDHNGSFEEAENTVGVVGAAFAATYSITDLVKPNARYKFVEAVAGFGTVTFQSARIKQL